MTSLKPMAMLSSQLLARKGTAVPAALGLQLGLIEELTRNPIQTRLQLRVTPRRPRPSASRTDGDALSHDDKSGGMAPGYASGAASPSDGAKVSLRLDADRHRRLRLLALHQRSSGQKLLLAALDAYLEAAGAAVMDGSCACLRSRLS
ncbi:MAG: hypothetical protein JO255_04735 [Alphaproteobacteria bacterium]|nr:hypothetical protein [Alphaproteobacteria bacterium]